MEKWITYHDGKLEDLSKADLTLELRVQRWTRNLLKRYWQGAITEYENCKNDCEEYSVKHENEWQYARHIARKQNAVAQRKARMEYLKMLYDITYGSVKEIEAILAMKRQHETIAKRSKKNVAIKAKDNHIVTTHIRKSKPVESTWNKEAFELIAKDRGFKVEEMLIQRIAEEWGITYRTTKKVLDTGRFTWAQVLSLGLLMEMTPREFAETFLKGYFKEVSDGTFRAWGNIEDFLYNPPPQTEMPPAEYIMVDESGRPEHELDYYEAMWNK